MARYAFASAFAPGRRTLDIACGTGYGTKLLHDAGAESVCGVDISSDAIAHACKNFDVPGTRYVQADICSYGDENAAQLICASKRSNTLNSRLRRCGTFVASSTPLGHW